MFGPKMGLILLDSRLPPLHVSACQTEGTEKCVSVLVALRQLCGLSMWHHSGGGDRGPALSFPA